MLLLELAVQGVRGFSAPARISLRQGLWHLQPTSAAASPIPPLLVALLYPEGRGEDAALATEKGARAALTFQATDGRVYRVLREFGRASVLEQWHPAEKRFSAVSSDAREMAQFLRATAGIPTRTAFVELLTLSPGMLPSRKGRKGPDAGGKGAGSGLGHAGAVEPAADVGAAKAKLAALQRELDSSGQIDRIQFELDGLAQEMDGLDQILKSVGALRESVQQLEHAVQRAPSVESLGLGGDLVQRCQRLEHFATRRDDALAQLEVELDAERGRAQQSAWVEPLHRDPRFLAGIGLGIVVLAAGAFLQGMGRYVALLDIPAFGFAAMLALRHVDALQSAERSVKRGDRLETRREKILSDYAQDVAPVQAAQKALGVQSAEEVVEVMSRKPRLFEQLHEQRAQLADAESDPQWQGATARHHTVVAERERLNAAMSELAGGYIRDVREVERELARVQESIALAMRQRSGAVPTDDGQGSFEDFGPALMNLATDWIPGGFDNLAGPLAERMGQYLGALTDKQCTAAEFDHEGRLFIYVGGDRKPVGELSAAWADAAYLSLRLTLCERIGAALPFLLEDGVLRDAAKFPVFGRMVKGLSAQTQVVWTSAQPAIAQAAAGSHKL